MQTSLRGNGDIDEPTDQLEQEAADTEMSTGPPIVDTDMSTGLPAHDIAYELDLIDDDTVRIIVTGGSVVRLQDQFRGLADLLDHEAAMLSTLRLDIRNLDSVAALDRMPYDVSTNFREYTADGSRNDKVNSILDNLEAIQTALTLTHEIADMVRYDAEHINEKKGMSKYLYNGKPGFWAPCENYETIHANTEDMCRWVMMHYALQCQKTFMEFYIVIERTMQELYGIHSLAFIGVYWLCVVQGLG